MDPQLYLRLRDQLRDRIERAEARAAQAGAAEAQAKIAVDRATADLDAAADDPHTQARTRATLDQARAASSEAAKDREAAEALSRDARRSLADHEGRASEVLATGTAAIRATVQAELAGLEVEWNRAAQALLAVAAQAAALDVAIGTPITVRSGSVHEKTPAVIYMTGEGIYRMLDAVRVPKFGSSGSFAIDRLLDADKARVAGRNVTAFGGLAERYAALDRLAQVAATLGQMQAAE